MKQSSSRQIIPARPDEGCSELLGFLAVSLVTVPVIGFNVLLLLGFYLYPKHVGLFVILPYYTYILALSRPERKYSARWEWFSRNFPLLQTFRRYLRMKVIVNDKLKDAQSKEHAQFLFAVFPHGCNSDYRIALDGMLFDAVPNVARNVTSLAATVLFRIPLVRELALWTNCVDASRSVADNLLHKGKSILVLPGGQAEQIHTVYGREIVYLKKRKGFIKLAMTHGVPVVPGYVFGASDYFYTSSFALNFRLWLVKTLGISIPLAFGQYFTPLCPRPVATTIVFGDPIRFTTKIDRQPIVEEVDQAHAQFCLALTCLFDHHKKEFGYGDRVLEIC
ncbi:hypothetical protein FisN_3Lh339 [Fistulifera solaris]|uniref:Acyltransferase n=1 Tax=Fistulifera solaris TaxID=1519565 RepID=A0A1Z5J824_FISSO|nr:hypothetical protein FisN_3Lh339 [Fistulifera solaris]|eukprot:GAX10144.1 hypothetical protein FisN_3Lh339 [Fistulifera solaris]